MLVEFTVSNFKSIKEPQTLSMVATNAKEHPDNVFQPSPNEDIKLLKTAVIYGANASGKSNLLEAVECFYSLVNESANYSKGKELTQYHPNKIYGDGLPISLEVEFFGFDKVRYRYNIEYNQKEILKEALYSYPKKQEVKLFNRIVDKNIEFGESLKGNKKIIENQLLSNQLFLSKGSQNNNELLGDLYMRLIGLFVFKNSHMDNPDYVSEQILSKGKPLLRASVNKLIKSVDFGFEEVRVEKVPNKRNKYEVNFLQEISQNKFVSFGLDEISDGTRMMYSIGGTMLSFLNEDFVPDFLIDELNNSLHPLLTRVIINLFHNPKSNPNNSQLIFTTHDTSLLSPELFRRDQIWFTEKDQYGATSLYSLAEFDFSKVRANVPFDKWYLSGRFGALPLIKDFEIPTHAETEKRSK